MLGRTTGVAEMRKAHELDLTSATVQVVQKLRASRSETGHDSFIERSRLRASGSALLDFTRSRSKRRVESAKKWTRSCHATDSQGPYREL